MINQEIAQIFYNIADYLEMQDNTNIFRIRAFRKAAESVDSYPKDVAKLNIYELKKIPGVGQSTADSILEYAKTGKIKYYEELKEISPVKLEELTKIQGMGPKRVKKLFYELGIKNVEELKLAAEGGKIAKLEGFGEKSQQSILENINFAIRNKDRILIDVALNTADELLNYIKSNDKNLIEIEYAGSLRRRRETIGDIDILASSKDPAATTSIFTSYPKIEKVLGSGETKSSIWLKDKIQVDLRIVPKESFGSALQYFTGSTDHNIELRKIAIKKGYKLSEYGLFTRKENVVVESKSEVKLYDKLLGSYIEPEMRESEGEIELAQQNKLPKLVEISDIKGDLQMHTTFSDGKNTMTEMVERCIDLKYSYMGFTDHFGRLYVANAVEENEFNKYFEKGLEVKEKYKEKINVLVGAEVNIKPEGDLDFDQKLLEKLDFVVASIHSSFKQDLKKATDRYLNVLQNPVVTIIGHPTGRLVERRKGIEFNYTTVFNEASSKGIAIEINAHPMRQDLPYNLVKLAKIAGCKIQISTDAHSKEELDLMKYGIFVARKAGLEEKDLFKIK